MYQDGAVEQSELNEVQHKCWQNDIAAAEYLLNIVIARPTHVYELFLQALETSNQLDAYLLLTFDGLNRSVSLSLHRETTLH